jgi:hypothetical protein
MYGIITIVFLIISLIVLLQTAYIQTKIAQYIAKELSLELNTEIKISHAKISLFRGIVFKDFQINDRQKDTLLYVKELSVVPSGLQTDFKHLSFNKIKLDNLYFNVYALTKDTSNISFLLDYLKDDQADSDDKSFRIEIDKFELTNSKFRYCITDSIKKPGFNSNNITISHLNISLKNFIFKNDEISAHNLSIALIEKNGFEIKNLSSEFVEVNSESIKLKKFDIVTNASDLNFDSLNLYYPHGYDFDNFKTTLRTNISIRNTSRISYNDIKYFINDTSKINEQFNLSGKINGSPDSLIVDNFTINYYEIFDIKINGYLKHLFTSKDPSFFVNVENFATDIEKIKDIPFKGKENFLGKIPKELENIKTLNYSGETKGTFSKFDSFGEISGNFGSVKLNVIVETDSLLGTNVTGMFSGEEIDLAQPTGDDNFGMLSFNQEIDLTISKKKKINLITKGIIQELIYRNYSYKEINLYTEINDKKIDSLGISINQPEIRAQIFGNINFMSAIPEINLIVDVKKADLKKMNLEKTKIGSNLSFSLNAFFNGINLDDFTGVIFLSKPLKYSRDSASITMNQLELSGTMIKVNDTLLKKIVLNSDIADISLISNGKASEVIRSLRTFLNNLFTVKPDSVTIFVDTITNGYLTLDGVIKKPGEITNLFFRDINVANNSVFSGNYDPRSNVFNLSVNSATVMYKNFTIKDFYAVAYTRENRFYAGTGGSSLKAFEPVFIENVSFESDFKNDSLNFNLAWNNYNDTSFYAGDINGNLALLKTNDLKAYVFYFNDSKVILKNNIWSFNNSKISIDSSKITISDLIFKNNDQEIYVDGNISKNPGDILFTKFNNFDINNLTDLLPESVKLTGRLYGSAVFAQLYENPLIFTKDSVLDLSINDIQFGNFYINSNWDDENNKIHTNAYNLKGSKKQFMNDTISGDYWPDKDSISMIAEIRSMTLQTFKQYFEDFVEFNNTAYITGTINLFGKLDKLNYSGNLKLKQTSFRIKYLNTINTLEEPEFFIDNKIIKIEDTRIRSNTKYGFSDLSGTITHDNFSKFYLDINLKPDNFVITDLNPTDSSYFWGKSIASGNINISGPIDDIYLDADITTEKNTNIFIPISSAESLSEENNFIRFIKDTSEQQRSGNPDTYNFETSGFSMNIKMNVTPDAQLNIIPYENTGDIRTIGDGKITLDLNREGDFTMLGTYTISSGSYNFNLMNIINKDFKIQEGSRIDWYGDPADASVNINAFYFIENVALRDLGVDEDETKKTDVSCFIRIGGTLLAPELKLYIELPGNTDEAYLQVVKSFAEKEMNEQFLSLLLIESFLPVSGNRDVGTDPNRFLQNALNNVLKQTGYDIGVIYESSTDANYSDKYGIQFSQKIWGDRIELKGNVGYEGGSEINPQNDKYVGEFEIEGKLNSKGTVRIKGYNKANNKFENEGDYIQGIGIVWRGKFNSLFTRKKERQNSVVKDSVKIYKYNPEIK